MSSEWEVVGGGVAGGSAGGSAGGCTKKIKKFFKTGGKGGKPTKGLLLCLFDS